MKFLVSDWMCWYVEGMPRSIFFFFFPVIFTSAVFVCLLAAVITLQRETFSGGVGHDYEPCFRIHAQTCTTRKCPSTHDHGSSVNARMHQSLECTFERMPCATHTPGCRCLPRRSNLPLETPRTPFSPPADAPAAARHRRREASARLPRAPTRPSEPPPPPPRRPAEASRDSLARAAVGSAPRRRAAAAGSAAEEAPGEASPAAASARCGVDWGLLSAVVSEVCA